MKHFIFDMGGVLLKTTPHKLIMYEDSFVQFKNEKIEKKFMNTFLEFEKGNITTDEYVKILNPFFNKKNLTSKEYEKNYFDINTKYGGVFPNLNLLKKLKDEGYNIYLLSNLHEVSYKYFSTIFDVNIFDELFLSFKLHMIKPDYNIYKYVIKKINDNPNNICFFDDTIENIEAAKINGINAFQTTGETLENNILLAKQLRE